MGVAGRVSASHPKTATSSKLSFFPHQSFAFGGHLNIWGFYAEWKNENKKKKLLIGHRLSASSICTRRPNDPCISVGWHARAPHRRRCPPARWQTPAAVRLRRGGSCHLEPHEISKPHPGLGERNPYAGPRQGELCKPQTELPSIVVLTRGSNRTSSEVLLERSRGFVLFFHPVPAH